MEIPQKFNEIDWDMLGIVFPDIEKLKDCPQDAIWHAEGDVFTHTQMVVEALMNHADWQQADSETQEILWWSALFHDIAKPLTTVTKNGRIRSPRHAIKGAQVTQNLLYQDFPVNFDLLPLAQRQKIVHLIRYHGLPLWFWDKKDMLHVVVEASQYVPCELIALLSEADALGRICNDQQDLLESVTLFREYCRDNECYKSAYTFPSAHSRFLYFQNSSNHPSYQAYDDTVCEVTLMSGLPGAGKDTWLKHNKTDLPVISLDAIRREMAIKSRDNQSAVVIQAKEQARIYLREGQSFAWNATNLTRRLRKPLIDLFTNYNARVKIVYVEASWQDLLSRNLSREHKIPSNVLYKMAKMLDLPSITEANDVIWGVFNK